MDSNEEDTGTINRADEHFVSQVRHNANSSLSKGKNGEESGGLKKLIFFGRRFRGGR